MGWALDYLVSQINNHNNRNNGKIAVGINRHTAQLCSVVHRHPLFSCWRILLVADRLGLVPVMYGVNRVGS